MCKVLYVQPSSSFLFGLNSMKLIWQSLSSSSFNSSRTNLLPQVLKMDIMKRRGRRASSSVDQCIYTYLSLNNRPVVTILKSHTLNYLRAKEEYSLKYKWENWDFFWSRLICSCSIINIEFNEVVLTIFIMTFTYSISRKTSDW
jgi:hypothetical protein